MLQQMKELGLNVKVLVTGGSAWPDSIVQLAGPKAAEGAMFINFYNPYDYAMAGDPEASRAYVEEWKKRNLPWIGVVEGKRGFDAVNVVAKAIENAKEPTAPKIQVALRGLEMKGSTGLIRIRPEQAELLQHHRDAGEGREVRGGGHDAGHEALGDGRRRVIDDMGGPKGALNDRWIHPARRQWSDSRGRYALMGIGLTLIFGIMRVVNFATASSTCWAPSSCSPLHTGRHQLLRGWAPGRGGCGAGRAVVERLVLRRLRDQPIEIPMLATVASRDHPEPRHLSCGTRRPSQSGLRSRPPLTLGPVHMVAIGSSQG
jgi:hypothetical protein